ncbi:MAG: aerobic carbon-monoxide dehydrogenase large subunit [Thermoleophilia bacterium]
MATRLFGAAVRRTEDERLLRGGGCYLDDVPLPGALHVAFLRSPVAHARIVRLDVTAARAARGVAAVYTHADLGPVGAPLPLLFPGPALPHPRTQEPLASTDVDHVGQTIAMVVAESRYLAEDALELIELELDELPVVVGPVAAARAGAPLVHEGLPSNVAGTVVQVVGDPDAAFAAADVVLRLDLTLDRGAAMPMATRGVAARRDPRTGQLDVWDSTQAAIPVRGGLISALGLPEERVRVVAPDTGGGFGVKAYFFYPEELLVPWAALRHDAPVKWVEDRQEHFLGSTHERLQAHEVEVAATSDGEVLAIRDRFVHDAGAFIAYGLTTPTVTASQIAGPYRVPSQRVEFSAVYTNTVPTSPYRGAGRPHACFVMERVLDRLAAELGLDRAEIRRRNLVTAFPWRRDGVSFADGSTVELDSGDYLRQLDLLLDGVGYEGFAAERAAARAEGRLLGIGLACYVEATGMGPYEGARVEVQGTTGRVHVRTGLTTQGQSHATTLAQIAADELGVGLDQVVVTTGDTAEMPYGAATYGSRTAVVSGNAVARAATAVREKALRLAAGMLEAAPDDLELAEGRIVVRGAPERSVTLKQVALAANPMRYAFDPEVVAVMRLAPPRPEGLLPPGDDPSLEATEWFAPPRVTWASGAHAAVVEVEAETGRVTVVRYVAVHDCGRVVNPLVVEGQVTGGVAQGVAGALYERLAYDEHGQLRNASFMDFLVPFASELPSIAVRHLESPSPLNPLGIKGAGEAGVIPGAAVIASAIEDALREDGVLLDEMPIDPARLHALIRAARAG